MKENNTINRIIPFFYDGIIEGKYLYAFDNRIKSMCKLNLQNMSLYVLKMFEGIIPINIKRIVAYRNNFILQIDNSPNILFYNRDTNNYSLYEFSKDRKKRYSILIFENYIYFIPLLSQDKMICFNLDKKEYFEQANSLEKIIGIENEILRPFMWGNKIAFPTQVDNSLIFISTKDYSVEKIYLEKDIVPYIAAGNKNQRWMIERNTNAIYGLGKNECKISVPKYEYRNLQVLDDYICLMPWGDSPLVILNLKDYSIRVIEVLSNIIRTGTDINASSFIYCASDTNYIYLFSNLNGRLYRVKKSDFSFEMCTVLNDEYYEKVLNACFKDFSIKFENHMIDINQYIGAIMVK